MAIILSTEPKTARWMITGLFLSSPSWLKEKEQTVGHGHFSDSPKKILTGLSPYKGKIKPDGQLKIQLDGGTLVIPPNCIFNLYVNLQHQDEVTIDVELKSNNSQVRDDFFFLFLEFRLFWYWPLDHKKLHLQGLTPISHQIHSDCFQVAKR